MNCDIEIDGSIGGGSVLRVAVPLALGLNKSIKITNIRAARTRPGLRNQHLLGLEALASITGSELIGGFIGSQTVQFSPINTGKGKSKINIDIDTAASVSLILQVLSNYSFVSGNEIDLDFIGGGSHTNWSPNLDYVKYVTSPVFQKFGQKINVSLERVGFYPKGGAKGNIKIESHLVNTPVLIKNTQISNIFITLVASSNLKKANVLERQLEILSNKLSSHYDITTKLRYEETPSSGTVVTVIVNYLSNIPKGISKLGERGVSSEKIASLIYQEIKKEISKNSAVDEFMADQLILPLALSQKGSSITIASITEHVRGNLELVQLILGDRIKIEETSLSVRLTRI